MFHPKWLMRKFSLVFADDQSENEERKNRGTFVDPTKTSRRGFSIIKKMMMRKEEEEELIEKTPFLYF